MNFLVINRAFNDIDHITPVIYKLLENGHKVNVLISNEYLDYENDYRLKFIEQKGAIVESGIKYSKFKNLKIIFDFLKKIYFSKSYNFWKKKISFALLERLSKKIDLKEEYFKDKKIDVIIFDWTNPKGDNLVIKSIFEYAKKNNKVTFCIPHGLNIYYNDKITSNYKKSDFHDYNYFDYIVVNNEVYKNTLLKDGVEEKKLFVLGSARFSPEWIKINDEISPKIKLEKTDKKILTFMPQQAQYNIDLQAQVKLIEEINKLDNYLIYFKPHTRNQNEKFFDKVSKLKNVRMANNILSSQLIDISDGIIVYGSSIVLEATYKSKLVLYPKFLHKNETIFEKYNGCEKFESLDEIIKYLEKGLKKHYTKEDEKNTLIHSSNSNDSKNILQDYVEFFEDKYREFNNV